MSVERRQLTGRAELSAALDHGSDVALVVHVDAPSEPADLLLRRCRTNGIACRVVSAAAIARWASRGGTFEMLALVGPTPDANLDELIARPGAIWLLDRLAYPGNIGFALRTADVSGAAGVVVLGPLEPGVRRRALRASMQSHLFLPVAFAGDPGAAETVIGAVQRSGRTIVVIENDGNEAPWDVDLTGDVALVVGGERHGVSHSVRDAADHLVRIPMAGFIPSYNVQAAVAAVASERLRQLSR